MQAILSIQLLVHVYCENLRGGLDERLDDSLTTAKWQGIQTMRNDYILSFSNCYRELLPSLIWMNSSVRIWHLKYNI